MKLYAKFREGLRAAEATIAARNANPTLSHRGTEGPGQRLEYTHLIPSSAQAGVSLRGVPNSISI